MMTETNTVRPSPIAGTWYSANPHQLQQTVDRYIKNAQLPDLPGEVIGLVTPHAGYQYSGQVAGHAFKAVAGKTFDYVIILSPMHQYYPQNLLTSAHRAYRTPLGDVPVARDKLIEISTALMEKTSLSLTPVAHDREHSLEIELPFLQCALDSNFELIPLMLRSQNRQVSRALGKILAEVFQGDSCLFVASSDLSHFYPETTANQLDQRVLAALAEFSPEALFDLQETGEGQACGLPAIASVLWAARELGASEVTVLNYDTSASATGDRSSVVGYGAAAITRPLE